MTVTRTRKQQRKRAAKRSARTARKASRNASRRATRKQRGGDDLRGALYGPLTIQSEFSAPGSSCSCNKTGGKRTAKPMAKRTVKRSVKRTTRKRERKQRGGDLDSFFNHPWVSTSPENTAQRLAVVWQGQPAFVPMDPTVSTYKSLSDVDLRTGYFNNSILTSQTL